jgi:hypothetical protein
LIDCTYGVSSAMRSSPSAFMPAMAPVIGDEQGMPGRALCISANTSSSPITMAPDVQVKPATSILKFGMITRMPPSTSVSMRASVSGVMVASFQMRDS